MKIVFILFFAFNCLFSFGQSVNLGTTYFRNDRFLISFDKVLYPGYNLKIENLQKREYLMGQLVQDTVYQGSWDVMSEIYENSFNYTISFDPFDYSTLFPCIFITQEECFYLSGNIKISGNKIVEENYAENSMFQTYSSSSAPVKRMNKDGSKVEVVSIESNIDFQTNQIVQTETILETRPLSSKELADREGNIYLTTTIGEQTWMAENLRATKFSNGVEIPLLTEVQWANSTAPGIIRKDPEGTYYNFYTLESENNVCPQGFHVPNKTDIAELYNNITPYGDHLKLSGNNVKIKVYSPVFAPVVVPLMTAFHLGWWGTAAAIDASLLSLTAAADVTLWSLQATAAVIDATVISPIFGWEGKKRQYKENLKKAQRYSYIDGNGKPYNKTQKGFVATNLKPINKSEWKNFSVIESFINDSSKTDYRPIEDQKKIDSLKNAHIDYKYKLRYTPLVLSGLYANNFWSTTAWFLDSDYFYEANGLFGVFNIMPYRIADPKFDYPNNSYSCSFGRYDYQPVLTLLLNKGENEFADQYGFNLNFDNKITFPNSKEKGKGKTTYFSFRNSSREKYTGISYIDGLGLPAYFGILDGKGKKSMKMDAHELNQLENIWSERVTESDVMRIQTRVRCVKD
jgi:hypothetical protein